jgi:hypothetical protein
MKTAFVTAMAVMLVLASATAYDTNPASDVSGTWSMSVKGQGAHGDTSAELVLTQDGRKVTGKLSAHGNSHGVEGEFVDKALKLATTTGDSDHQLSLTAKLQDDGTLAGYLSGPMGDLRWTASRAKDTK